MCVYGDSISLIHTIRHDCTGASSDFEQATEIATRMVTKFGMSAKLGHGRVIKDKQTMDDHQASGETRDIIDKEIRGLLDVRVGRVCLMHVSECVCVSGKRGH